MHCVSFALPRTEHRKTHHTQCDLADRCLTGPYKPGHTNLTGPYKSSHTKIDGDGSDHGNYSSDGGGNSDGGSRDGGLVSRTEFLSLLPEPCVQIAILQPQQQQQPPQSSSSGHTSNVRNNVPSGCSGPSGNDSNDATGSHGRSVVIGLSQRGKLFCGESLLVAGVSSFVANVTLDVLMYVTTGSNRRPVQ